MKWLALATLGGAVLVLVPWMLARLGRRYGTDAIIAQQIKPPVSLHTGSDEAQAARAKQRREAADRIRARAAAVESGAKVADVLRMVK